jgi:hypothetical protein
MCPHRSLCAAMSFLRGQPPIRVDLVLEPRHEAVSCRSGDLPPVVPGRARKAADASDLATDNGIVRCHDYVTPAGNRGRAEAGEIRRRWPGSASVK